MNIHDFLPVVAGLVGLLAVVVFSSLILGGYGLILSGAVVAVMLSGSQDQDSQTDSRNA